MSRLLSALWRLFAPRRRAAVADPDALADFLATRTAYVSQRTVLEYCRARTGLNWDKLFQEEAFAQSFDVCRWEAYAILLPEIGELAQIRLRREGAFDPQTWLPGLVETTRAALWRHPVPTHRSGWDDASEAVERRLGLALLAEPRPVHLMGADASDAIFAILPIHADLRREDREMFRNSLRFALCKVFEETRHLEVPALEASLREHGSEATGDTAP